ncbi:MAG TPA: MBL fold metallo-hydrolase [Terriglobales bacterium]|nr:MBL fold metallo-hydrolase [Terriglobales bacterium]
MQVFCQAMGVSVSVLASGSRGNCAIISSSSTRILLDAGISCRETFKRLKALGDDLPAFSAILITHEHSDHVYGLQVLARKTKAPVFMTGATHQTWARALRDENGECPKLEKLELFAAGKGFQIGDIAITPFTIPHDAADPVGFTFRAEGVKIGFATDLGYMPASVCHHLRGCDVLVLESNHDLEMLRGGPYPWSVKQRVMSRVGHLSNEALAQFFAKDYDGEAAYVVLAHLSEQNNHPELARGTAERALGPRQTLLRNRLMLAAQARPLDPIRM